MELATIVLDRGIVNLNGKDFHGKLPIQYSSNREMLLLLFKGILKFHQFLKFYVLQSILFFQLTGRTSTKTIVNGSDKKSVFVKPPEKRKRLRANFEISVNLSGSDEVNMINGMSKFYGEYDHFFPF